MENFHNHHRSSYTSNCDYDQGNGVVVDNDGNEGRSHHDYGSSCESKGNIHQFSFVKIHNFVDPSLKSKIEMAMKLRKELHEAKQSILTNTNPLKEKHTYEWLKSRREGREAYLRMQIEYYGLKGGRITRTSGDQNPKRVDINEKIKKLKNGVIHGTTNVVEERRKFNEIKELQKMKEQLKDDGHQNSKLDRISISNYYYYCYHLSKSDPLPSSNSKRNIQRYIHGLEEKVKLLLAKEREAKKQYERKLAEFEKECMKKDQNLCEINKKNALARQRILAAQKELDELETYYDEYIQCLNTAKDLAAKKDLISLEELSKKQVEEFICRWNNDDKFRANYTKGVMDSLDSRCLSNDGRRRNVGEKLTACDMPGKPKFTWPGP